MAPAREYLRERGPKVATLKSLFALSCNRCAYQDPATGEGCEEILARPQLAENDCRGGSHSRRERRISSF
jgi:hypothetical protein